FQAEDGIRDRNVTGVQTCALPICTTTRWDTRRAAWTCCPTSAPRSEAVAGIAARRGARRAAGAGPCRLQRAAEERRRDRRLAHQIGRASCRERAYVEEGGDRREEQ